MQISFVAPSDITAGAWVVGAGEGGALLPAAARADKASGGALSRALKVSRFTGKPGQMLEVLAPGGAKASRLLLVGLGKSESLDEKALETLGARIAGRLYAAGETLASLEIDVPKNAKVKKAELAAHLAFGARLKSYAFDKYRTKNRDEFKKKLKPVRFVSPDGGAAKKAYGGRDGGGNEFFPPRARVNDPPNILYPKKFARR